MTDIQKITWVAQTANELMEIHGLKADGWTFDFNHGKQRVAVCRYGPKKIEYSLHFIKESDERAIIDTILHEIAHALVGHKAGHGYLWQRKCIEIGAKPERLTNEAAGTKSTTAKRYNYKLECPQCGASWMRHRLKKSMHGARCPRCNVEIIIYKLRYV